MTTHFKNDKLSVFIYPTTDAMAREAAKAVTKAYLTFEEAEKVNIMFGGAESQKAFQRELMTQKEIDWNRVHAFNIDDYWDPSMDPRFSVGACLDAFLYDSACPGWIDRVNCCAPDAEIERARYENVLKKNQLHIACIGVGESGHIGLNEQGQTDFQDTNLTRIITLPETSRSQLERDEFLGGAAIPRKGITTTVPKVMEAPFLIAVVPFKNKAEAVRKLLSEPVSEDCPATILKTHPNAHLYLDRESASLIQDIKISG